MSIVHDEQIDDSMYSVGWREVSTGGVCVKSKCECKGSGSCTFALFNHFMYREEEDYLGSNLDQFDFPLYITNGTADELSVEEVRCRRYIVGAAYNYYVRKVVHDPLRETLISVFLGDYKSTCFNMLCFLLEAKSSSRLEGYLRMDHEEKGVTSVLARGQEATASLLEAVCMLGINPIVSSEGELSLEILDSETRAQTLNVCISGFSNDSMRGVNVLGSLKSTPEYISTHKGKFGIRAVRTALVTMSVVLTPKSLYGGKNPTTKTVSYYVHNVKIQ